ncbi:MAG: hypothetical protein LC100_00400 [Chitinophagales bacterium]|nr:hypothetical protein [Chitinophagales bacterium]
MAKTELEDAGLETDGMVESTAKLRDLVKGISGVDIMLDENTFKSTYQIIEELGKVWNNIKDVDQASLLEAIAGKRQSNIVAAALTNYDRLDDVLQTSINSMGSARAEQEEYAKSIQYSINTLKAAYQDFADSVINSDFVKNLLGTAQSFLEVLTKIIDKFGALPTILTGIAAIGGIKGVGIFGTLDKDITRVTTHFDELKQVLSYDFGKTYKDYNINLSGLSAKDIDSLQQYVNLLNQGKTHSVAFASSMSEASEAARAQTYGFKDLKIAYEQGSISANQYKTATQNLALTQKTATATSKALSIALNTLANIGIMVAINLAIKGISALVDKLVVSKEELAEIRDEAVSSAEELKANVETFVEEADAIDELVQKYKEIHLSVTDINESKEQLVQIQTDLIDKFGGEASGIDLVNGEYEKQIDIINRLSQAKYEEWKREEAANIARVERINSYNVTPFGYNPNNPQSFDAYGDMYLPNSDDLAKSLYVVEDVAESIQDIYENVDGIMFEDKLFSNNNIVYLSGTIEDAKEQLGELIDLGRQQGLTDKDLKPLVERYNELKTELENIDYYMSEIRKFEAPDVEVVGEVSKESLEALKEYYSAADQVRSEWFESLEEMQNGFGKTVDSMTSALQTLANGDALSSTDFWNLMKIDADKVITDIQLVGDKFVINEEQLIKLKDQYINKQIDSLKAENETLKTKQKELSVTLERAQAEVAVLGARGLANSSYREEYNAAMQLIRQGKSNLAEYGEQIKRNNLVIDQWESKLGDTVDQTEALAEKQKKVNDEINALNKKADALLKAQEYKIDQIIDGHQEELDALNDEKDALQEELDALNEQKDALDEIVKNYETVNSLVQNTIEKEIDSLNEQKKAIEDTYNKRIEALKAENEEREDALEYAQKLANLENAKNNKRRVYDEARGWRYEAVKEDVAKAQNDLAEFETSKAVKELEKERDKETAVIDDLIKNKEEYAKIWKEISDEIQTEEDERLAQEILGADWRKKIAAGDIAIMNKFRAEYRNHNTALQNLTKTEIKLKEESIKAKEADIKAKQEQIDIWKKYKSEVEKTAEAIKAANEDYMDYLNSVSLSEQSTYADRQANLQNFASRYSSCISQIKSYQQELDNMNVGLYIDTNIGEVADEMANFIDTYRDAIEAMQKALDESETGYGVVNSAWDAMLAKAANEMRKRGYSQGGVVDYTGVAMLHGRKNAPETIFNAKDSAKLYEMVHNTPNLMASAMTEANKIAGFKLGNTNTNNSSVNISSINVYANNPSELARGLDKQLDQYFRSKLTQNYTSK